MKRWMKGLVAAGVLGLAAPAMAADWGTQGAANDQGTTGQMQPGAMGETGYTGTIKNVNQKKNMVTIEVPLAPGATILKDGKTVSLKQLKSGEQVRAAFDPQTHEIIRLDVQAKAMKGSKANKGMQNKGAQEQGTTPDQGANE